MKPVGKAAVRVGLISDTHGLLRPQALEFLRGCDFIVHAGDIGNPEVLERLATVAQVTAVRGNNDIGAWAAALGETAVLEVGNLSILVIHDLAQLDQGSIRSRTRVVVSGHSHKPGIDEREGVLFVNPGSAGPRRFTLPVSVGELSISGTGVVPRLHDLGNCRESTMKPE